MTYVIIIVSVQLYIYIYIFQYYKIDYEELSADLSLKKNLSSKFMKWQNLVTKLVIV